MNIKELIEQLEEIQLQYPDIEVYFDNGGMKGYISSLSIENDNDGTVILWLSE